MVDNIIAIKERIKCYCVSRFPMDASWINNGVVEICNTIEDSDVVIFPGGSDVQPSLYGEEKNILTSVSEATDEYQIKLFKRCILLGKFVIGICRGAQLSCVMAGGKLIQHVEHHRGGHLAYDAITKKSYYLNSTHHQMMFPYYLEKNEYELLCYSKKDCFDKVSVFTYMGANEEFRPLPSAPVLKDDPLFMEPEIVFFKKINALAIQCHPEMLTKGNPALSYINKIVLSKYMQHKMKNLQTT